MLMFGLALLVVSSHNRVDGKGFNLYIRKYLKNSQ